MRTHHNLAEVAALYKSFDIMPLARALTSYIDEGLNGGAERVDENRYKTAHYDPIILGFILGRTWPACEQEALAAIAKDFEYDHMIVEVSPRADMKAPVRVRGLDVSKLDFQL